MIVRVKEGYQVLSSKGKNLSGPCKTLEEAKKRLRQVEFFKHKKGWSKGREGVGDSLGA